MLKIIEESLSDKVLERTIAAYDSEHHLFFYESDPSTKNPRIKITLNPKKFDCFGLKLSIFNPKTQEPGPITRLFDDNAENVNKLCDGIIIGQKKGTDGLFVIIIEMKSNDPSSEIVKYQLDGGQAVFEYIKTIISLQHNIEQPKVAIYRFCFTSETFPNQKHYRNKPQDNLFIEKSNSYKLWKQDRYNIRHLLNKYKPTKY